jgi:hypothetical protein
VRMGLFEICDFNTVKEGGERKRFNVRNTTGTLSVHAKRAPWRGKERGGI